MANLPHVAHILFIGEEALVTRAIARDTRKLQLLLDLFAHEAYMWVRWSPNIGRKMNNVV